MEIYVTVQVKYKIYDKGTLSVPSNMRPLVNKKPILNRSFTTIKIVVLQNDLMQVPWGIEQLPVCLIFPERFSQ